MQTLREQARRTQCAGGLKQINLAMYAVANDPKARPYRGSGLLSDLRQPDQIGADVELVARPIIEFSLAEMEADDA